MKTSRIFSLLAAIAMIGWSCTTELTVVSLQSNLEKSSLELNTALTAIKNSQGYQVLATQGIDDMGMSKVYSPVIDSTFNTILLTDILGEYEFNKANTYKKWKQPINRFFSRTADNDSALIVRLPEEKVKRPNLLFKYNPADTLLTNNYVFSLNKYDYKFNRYLGWDYAMASTINVKNVDAGALSIQSSSSKESGYKFVSEFVFANGYSINSTYANGDTAVSVYAVKQGTNVLYEEKYTAIKTLADKSHREREYALTIGNVQIVRKAGPSSLDSAKVYVNGILQTAAKVDLVDISGTDATEISVTNHKREIKITFDDGSSKTISELLGTSVETIRNLFLSLRQSYFATSIIDRIAWDIYINKK